MGNHNIPAIPWSIYCSAPIFLISDNERTFLIAVNTPTNHNCFKFAKLRKKTVLRILLSRSPIFPTKSTNIKGTLICSNNLPPICNSPVVVILSKLNTCEFGFCCEKGLNSCNVVMITTAWKKPAKCAPVSMNANFFCVTGRRPSTRPLQAPITLP